MDNSMVDRFIENTYMIDKLMKGTWQIRDQKQNGTHWVLLHSQFPNVLQQGELKTENFAWIILIIS